MKERYVLKSQPGSSDVHVPSPPQGKKSKRPLPLEQLVPVLDNLEVEVIKAKNPLDSIGKVPLKPPFEARPKTAPDEDYSDFYSDMIDASFDEGPENVPRGTKSDPVDYSSLDEMQQLVDGIDWEFGRSTTDENQAMDTAIENLEADPDHYRKLWAQEKGTDDVLAKGLKVDLGSGQSRETRHVGLDLYPHDHGTIIHDVQMGIPAADESCSSIQLINAEDIMGQDPKPIMAEIQRVLMPGGQFTYEGPNQISGYPDNMEMTSHETNAGEVEKEETHRQTFTRKVNVDPATANDAEPRVGIGQYDNLPADQLLAAKALGYYYSDATTSGPSNREHGYPSQGALVAKKKIKVIDVGTDNTGATSKSSRRAVIFKADKHKQVVYGVVLAPEEVDEQDDWMTPEDIEETAHRYLAESRTAGSRHTEKIDACPVESYIAPQDFEFDGGPYGPQLVKKGSWVVAMKIIDPKEWKKVVDGDYQAFSVGGTGERS